jgi:hypothetical protein
MALAWLLPPEWTPLNVCLLANFVVAWFILGPAQAAKAEEGAVVWSKFAIGKRFKWPCPARIGMLTKYIFSFVYLVGLLCAMFLVPSVASSSGLDKLVELNVVPTFLLALHFAKRILEVLFVHNFEGSPVEDTPSCLLIGVFYLFSSWVYSNDWARNSANTTMVAISPLQALGAFMFFFGQCANWWHHEVLASLRKKKDDQQQDALISGAPDPSGKYFIPHRGCFKYVTCPHYFFECVALLGVGVAARNVIAIAAAGTTWSMLAGHSQATTRWYVQKFGDRWPKDRKHFFPFLF